MYCAFSVTLFNSKVRASLENWALELRNGDIKYCSPTFQSTLKYNTYCKVYINAINRDEIRNDGSKIAEMNVSERTSRLNSGFELNSCPKYVFTVLPWTVQRSTLSLHRLFSKVCILRMNLLFNMD